MAGNYKIDNGKFGAFLSQLRKEKGMTQKELAERLYVSDKAVSKWERGLSLPDIALLQPLAELMEVSVTEMLCGEIIRKDQPLTVQEIEPLINGALVMTAQEQTAQRENRRKWGMRFLWALALCAVEAGLLYRFAPAWLLTDDIVFMILPPLMALIFGVYFIFFSKEKLPGFYDQYKVNFYSDGIFRMNVPGVCFNNSNWPHILSAARAWVCLTLGGWVLVYAAARGLLVRLGASEWMQFGVLLPGTLFVILGGIMIPIYVVGKKYQ